MAWGRRGRDARRAVLAALGLLTLAAIGAASAQEAGGSARASDSHHAWGLGWDGYQKGLTLRWRPDANWELGLAAGPDDSKDEELRQEWDSDWPDDQQGLFRPSEDRRESGWVRLTAGRRFWRQGRVALSGDAGLTYAWSNTQSTSTYWTTTYDLVDCGYDQSKGRIRTWSVTIGLRPIVTVTERLTVEAEFGLAFARRDYRGEDYHWYDVRPDSYSTVTDLRTDTFRSFGPYYDWWQCKLVFWL